MVASWAWSSSGPDTRRPKGLKEAVLLPNLEHYTAEPRSEGSVVISIEEFTKLLALMQAMASTIAELYLWIATAGYRAETGRS